MVVCTVTRNANFLVTWAFLAGISWLFAMTLSAVTFYLLYWKPTYKMWRSKSNPEYPSPQKVCEEIIQMNKGLLMATLPPALTAWLAHQGYTYGYCHTPKNLLYELIAQFFFLIFLDAVEFGYHYLTHVRVLFWRFHKFHHSFYNPSPFAVIADEVVDQLVRASPMIIYPLFFPLNIDFMFFQMAVFMYGYGTYLHCGYELNYPDAHHPYLNTAFQHYCHHAISIINKPYHCGFILKIFDQIMGSVYTGKCFCCKCSRERGERSIERWNEIKKPDYSILLTFSFWSDALRNEMCKIKKGRWLRIV